jgi:hypothetical protein
MSDISLGEMTVLLKWTGIGLAVLALLLILIQAALIVMRRLVRQQMAHTDLDLVGQRAVVIQNIRPYRPGRIRCRTAQGDRTAEAVSDRMIRSGLMVLIIAVHQGKYRVVPETGKIPAEPAKKGEPSDPSLRPTYVELAAFDDPAEHAGHATLAAHIEFTEQAASTEYTAKGRTEGDGEGNGAG